MKTYFEQMNIGHARYVVNFTDGVKTHGDGSPFYDAKIFKNKKTRDACIRDLRRQGYRERGESVSEKTIVVFRTFKYGDHGVIALFPAEASDTIGRCCVSYMHVGQHGGADYAGCIHRTRPSTALEIAPLRLELEHIGYALDVRQRYTRETVVRQRRRATPWQ